jgi:nitrate reductase delta subunit
MLPALRKPDLALIAKAWADGPPAEDVGLEPFAPPEYLDGTRDLQSLEASR